MPTLFPHMKPHRCTRRPCREALRRDQEPIFCWSLAKESSLESTCSRPWSCVVLPLHHQDSPRSVLLLWSVESCGHRSLAITGTSIEGFPLERGELQALESSRCFIGIEELLLLFVGILIDKINSWDFNGQNLETPLLLETDGPFEHSKGFIIIKLNSQ